MPATTAQIAQYRTHKDICQSLGIGQSTLKHKTLAGALSAPSATGVVVYTPPAPFSPGSQETTTDTPMWIVWAEQTRRGNDDSPELGRVGVAHMTGQMPALADPDNSGVFGSPVTLSHDDWFSDMNGVLYRILNPVISEDGGYWSFEVMRQR